MRVAFPAGSRQPARGATIDFNFSERGGKIRRVAPEGGCFRVCVGVRDFEDEGIGRGLLPPLAVVAAGNGNRGESLLNSFAFISLFYWMPRHDGVVVVVVVVPLL